ncbi:MAG TPA: CHAD domain-containing protein, partial [Candidatus Paceibacterota bacterium]|nr:CHAD domain-containing protein [Candidatus Paceibacterota bacterium]
DLRDTQVQLQLLKPLWPGFPEAQVAKDFLEAREKRLATWLKCEAKELKCGELNRKLKAIEKTLRKCGVPEGSASDIASALLGRAFADLEKLRDQVREDDTATLHRFRIGLKRFRYLCQLLQPLLPRITESRLTRLRNFQNSAGEIQDLEVLLACFAAAVKHRRLNPLAIRNLRVELSEQKRRALNGILSRLDGIAGFRRMLESKLVPTRKPRKP